MSTTTRFDVPDVSCGHCKNAIEEGLSGLDGLDSGVVAVEAKQLTVIGTADPSAVLQRLDELGYPATIASPSS